MALVAAGPSAAVGDAEREQLRSRTLDALHAHVSSLPDGLLALRTGEAAKLREQFARREAWDGLTPTQAERLRDHLGPIPDGRSDGELARQIDLLTVEAQRALLLGQPVPPTTREAFRALADVLKKKTNLPAVAAAEPTINGLCEGQQQRHLTRPRRLCARDAGGGVLPAPSDRTSRTRRPTRPTRGQVKHVEPKRSRRSSPPATAPSRWR